MIAILRENPLLLLFIVAAIGYPLGRVKLGGNSLGVAAVLFAGLAIGALDPGLKLPEVVYQLGLVLFVYTVGLSSGTGFLASLKGKGLRDNLFVLGMILVASGLTVALHFILGFRASQTAGVFAGSLTNTPALAAAVEYLKGYAARTGVAQNLSDPVVGYSIAYPVSVLGMIFTIYMAQRLWRVDYVAETARLQGLGIITEALRNVTVRITNPQVAGLTVRELVQQQGWDVIFSRVKRAGQFSVAVYNTHLLLDDLVTVVGAPRQLQEVAAYLGEVREEGLDLDRTELDVRRIFVSNPKVAGMRLKDLGLPRRFGAVVTRVRRGDVDLLPHGDTILELGDRVRVLTRRENLERVARFFGDSYKAVSEIDMASFSFGLALGIVLGMVPIPLPGGLTIRLGLAGGPLIVALILGARSRTGPIIWSLPYSANLMLRQIGLILFLAGVGTRSGYEFAHTLAQGSGLAMLAASLVIVCVTGWLTLYVGYRVLRIPMGILTGMLAALQTQPATLGYTLEQSGNELPNLGYATVYPAAMVVKILMVQVLLTLLL
jgi:putative transport protein